MENDEMIPRKIAAGEVYRTAKKQKLLSIISICAIFIVMILTVFNMYAGMTGALVVCLYFGFTMFQNQKYLLYLEQKYKLKVNPYERQYQ